MTRTHSHRTVIALLGAALLAVPAAAFGQAAIPAPSGPDFAGTLRGDPKVTRVIKAALSDGRAFVTPAAFGDLTGDGRSDAVVLVTTPGAAGAIAAYVLSAPTADADLEVVYRSQNLYRAFVRASRGALVVLTPDYARGDDVCCPAARLERTYVYDRRAKVFRRTSSRRLPRSAS